MRTPRSTEGGRGFRREDAASVGAWSDWLRRQAEEPHASAEFKDSGGVDGRRFRRFHAAIHAEAWSFALDLGCGTGFFRDFFRPGAYVGVDVSEEAVALARGRWPGDLFARIDPPPAPLPFSSGLFDLAVVVGVLQHSPDDVKGAVLAELARVVRPGGRLLLWEHASGDYAPAYGVAVPPLFALDWDGYDALAARAGFLPLRRGQEISAYRRAPR